LQKTSWKNPGGCFYKAMSNQGSTDFIACCAFRDSEIDGDELDEWLSS
jgi:hypothetical protein